MQQKKCAMGRKKGNLTTDVRIHVRKENALYWPSTSISLSWLQYDLRTWPSLEHDHDALEVRKENYMLRQNRRKTREVNVSGQPKKLFWYTRVFRSNLEMVAINQSSTSCWFQLMKIFWIKNVKLIWIKIKKLIFVFLICIEEPQLFPTNLLFMQKSPLWPVISLLLNANHSYPNNCGFLTFFTFKGTNLLK